MIVFGVSFRRLPLFRCCLASLALVLVDVAAMTPAAAFGPGCRNSRF